uniref:Uncharacterized protein n=1 Tax=Arundo donax TaxID=35708 RepID=A0A0A9C4H1_ARUDO
MIYVTAYLKFDNLNQDIFAQGLDHKLTSF